MSRTLSVDTVILRTVDIGDADRFCILFTKERGRMAVRAKGVRKMTSRLGGTLLPFRHVALQLAVSDHGSVITAAVPIADITIDLSSFETFVRLQRGIELLFNLTEDNEPLPRVFDLLLQFMALAPSDDCDPLSAFSVRLLSLLGLLPSDSHDPRFSALPLDAQMFVQAATKTASLLDLCRQPHPSGVIDHFVMLLVTDQTNRPLRAAEIVGDL